MMSLSWGIRYPSPLWSLTPLGLVAFGVKSGSAQSTCFAPPCEQPVLPCSPLGGLQHTPSGLLGRQTYEARISPLTPFFIIPYALLHSVRQGLTTKDKKRRAASGKNLALLTQRGFKSP